MIAQMSIATTVALMTLTAIGYAVATLGMKLAADQFSTLALALMAAGLTGAAFAEVALLRQASLPVIYLGIIGFETLLVLCIAAAIGDVLSLQQLSGALLVLLGMVLVTH